MNTEEGKSPRIGLGTLSLVLLVVDLCLLAPIAGVSALLGTFIWPRFFAEARELGCAFGEDLSRLAYAETWRWFIVLALLLAVALTVKEVWMKSKTTAFVINMVVAGVCLSYIICYTVLNVAMVYDFLFRLPRGVA